MLPLALIQSTECVDAAVPSRMELFLPVLFKIKLPDEVADNLPLLAVTGENDSLHCARLVLKCRIIC